MEPVEETVSDIPERAKEEKDSLPSIPPTFVFQKALKVYRQDTTTMAQEFLHMPKSKRHAVFSDLKAMNYNLDKGHKEMASKYSIVLSKPDLPNARPQADAANSHQSGQQDTSDNQVKETPLAKRPAQPHRQ
ncbi:hypothetical protein PTSG_00879 [Salpingoeca rosetta]|uniref:Uncharacterized protein n=1 Tax=Salpingoeca rosetta (strain ATCC 50818 / BSB-021) TaxID=946362 RepID=F2TXR4_SALR5|nr:uncharacterized protein PTSG_00879 [Salpingoeca rosetta]EGD76173.1 hypothetical protein PTSG_00879 [Salpingoeca rosetta]|eukprot:XP_004998348.1 hypothetical protein PTSG_00879 [Salpingoeca rosetta]